MQELVELDYYHYLFFPGGLHFYINGRITLSWRKAYDSTNNPTQSKACFVIISRVLNVFKFEI